MVTVDEVRALALSLPRAYEVLVRDQVKFRVGRLVFIAFSRDETRMGCGFPKEEREAAIAPRLKEAREAHRRRLEAAGGEGDDFADGASSREQDEVPAHIVEQQRGGVRAAIDADNARRDAERQAAKLRARRTELAGRAASEPAKYGEELRRVELELAQLEKTLEAEKGARWRASRVRTGAGY